ncbi:MAG: hypothetical protein QM520_06210, partial [Gammaproteobacteria bacterium]|nr:hypothetical protein [Gammaproteobacteria bacterium]
QISLSYEVSEDRLLLRVNTNQKTEYRIWLTRRLVLEFVPQLQKIAENTITASAPVGTSFVDQESKKMYAEFKKQEILEKSDFKTPFDSSSTSIFGDHPLLLTEIHINALGKGNFTLKLCEKLLGKAERSFEVTVYISMIQAIIHLLGQATQGCQWLEIPHAASLPMPFLEDSDDLEEEKVPKYIN